MEVEFGYNNTIDGAICYINEIREQLIDLEGYVETSDDEISDVGFCRLESYIKSLKQKANDLSNLRLPDFRELVENNIEDIIFYYLKINNPSAGDGIKLAEFLEDLKKEFM